VLTDSIAQFAPDLAQMFDSENFSGSVEEPGSTLPMTQDTAGAAFERARAGITTT
jgi:hypothetical protein